MMDERICAGSSNEGSISTAPIQTPETKMKRPSKIPGIANSRPISSCALTGFSGSYNTVIASPDLTEIVSEYTRLLTVSCLPPELSNLTFGDTNPPSVSTPATTPVAVLPMTISLAGRASTTKKLKINRNTMTLKVHPTHLKVIMCYLVDTECLL